MNQKTMTANTAIASSVPSPTERMLMALDMTILPLTSPAQYKPGWIPDDSGMTTRTHRHLSNVPLANSTVA